MYADLDCGLTRAEAVKRLNSENGFVRDVTAHMVSMWALRGWVDPATGLRRRLTVVGVDRDGTRRYALADLLAADAATGRHPNSHRKAAA